MNMGYSDELAHTYLSKLLFKSKMSHRDIFLINTRGPLENIYTWIGFLSGNNGIQNTSRSLSFLTGIGNDK